MVRKRSAEGVDVRFGKRFKRAREAKGLSQTETAERLKGWGITAYGSTIAKIEAGTRPVKLAELVAVTELFEVSVDTLLGRREADPRFEQAHALRMAVDTATKLSTTIVSVESALRDRLTDLAAFDDLPGRDTLIASFERAYNLLVDADSALTEAWRVARKSVGDLPEGAPA
jgi:transcriptional regulator with XRE-family HTH domain